MSLHIFYSMFLIFYCCPLITTGCSYVYNQVRATPYSPALCGVGNPDTTHVVESLALCSRQCSKTDNCLYFNYITSPNQQPACQLYNSQPQNTVVDPQHCVLFAVRLKSSFIVQSNKINVLFYLIAAFILLQLCFMCNKK